MDGISLAYFDGRSIRIEKLSPNTDTGCVSQEVLDFLGITEDRATPAFKYALIGNNVWRAKIGKHGLWGYGRSIDAALTCAFNLVV